MRILLKFWGQFLYSDTFPTHFTHVKDDFLMNSLIQGKSGTTPVMSWNAFSTNQGTNEDDSQSDPNPEAGIFGNQMMRKSGQKDRRDMVTGVREQTRNGQKDRRYKNVFLLEEYSFLKKWNFQKHCERNRRSHPGKMRPKVSPS